jgi:acyl-coenzyme A thioesterase PaaI-like protein
VTESSFKTQSIFELFDHIGFRDYRNADGDLVDIAAGMLAIDDLPPDISVVTSDLSVRYLRPIKTGAARAIARIAYSGKRSVVMQVDIVGLPDEELAAIATVSFATVRPSA